MFENNVVLIVLMLNCHLVFVKFNEVKAFSEPLKDLYIEADKQLENTTSTIE